MSDYIAMQLGSIAGMMASEQSRRAGNEFHEMMEARKNRPPVVDPASFYKLIDDYNQLASDFNDLRLQVLRKNTIIAEKELALANLTAELHQTQFKLDHEIKVGAASVRTIGRFLKAYRHYRGLLGIKEGDPYDVPGYW